MIIRLLVATPIIDLMKKVVQLSRHFGVLNFIHSVEL